MSDLIERQTAIEAIAYSIELCNKALDSMTLGGRDRYAVEVERNSLLKLKDDFKLLPSAQPERLADDDFETIRIHLNAYKEKLCNQHRWKEADEYQRIIDRFMTFASAQPDLDEWCPDCKEYDSKRHYCPRFNRVIREALKDAKPRKTGKWIRTARWDRVYFCDQCGNYLDFNGVNAGRGSANFCPNCGADMRGEAE